LVKHCLILIIFGGNIPEVCWHKQCFHFQFRLMYVSTLGLPVEIKMLMQFMFMLVSVEIWKMGVSIVLQGFQCEVKREVLPQYPALTTDASCSQSAAGDTVIFQQNNVLAHCML